MNLKPGVKLAELKPQLALAAIAVYHVYAAKMLDCTITSGNDSKHKEGSLHYAGQALDFRTHNFVGDKKVLKEQVAAALGEEFDVLIEDLEGPNEHLHVEWDPK